MTLSAEQAVDLCRQALMLALLLAAPILIVAAVVGVVSGLLQTLFHVQDQSIAFVPKLIVSSCVLLACLPWIFSRMIEFTQSLFVGIGM
ncbi:flagellar biosynthetic protein FliQ [Roseiconus nitratireducens]|uniref:Flagellar biosynthetic protein FliQ n=1 Tax=Roseiconus nitratireducens TaxID=2605748 RepID=A0A5M6DAL7_9BACT|nr:flagellar biosynthetic protein FliQ [Roseiconus nitratireducens]KAA5544413.1 flagellar biosynthetic protein FliQ [Roseiconus nitratireducens]